MKDINKKFKLALLWSFFGQFGVLIIVFITNILMARLLSPDEFGVIAIATFFILLSNVLLESGLSGALIRKKDATDIDYSTIFFFNLSVGILLYIILFFTSHLIEEYYAISQLGLYLKVLGLVLVITPLQIIQYVKLVKKLEYKKITAYNFSSTLISSSIAIYFASVGYGVWSLIIQQILKISILTCIYWIREGRLKEFKFSNDSFKEMYNFGLYTTLSSIINTIFDNIYQLILTKHFSLNQTGLYYQAKKLTEIPVGMIKTNALGVVFSTLSNIQDDKQKFDSMYNSVIRIFTVIVGLMCLLIFIFSKEILYIFYGMKWLSADFYMKIITLSSFFFMQEMFNRVLYKVFNQTRKIFILEILKKSINVISLLIGLYYQSIEILMYGYLFTSLISYFINYFVSKTVYQSNGEQNEMKYTILVMLTILFIIYLNYTFSKYIQLELLFNLTLLPFIVLIYMIILKVLKVFDFKKDFALVKSLKK